MEKNFVSEKIYCPFCGRHLGKFETLSVKKDFRIDNIKCNAGCKGYFSIPLYQKRGYEGSMYLVSGSDKTTKAFQKFIEIN